MRRLARNVLHTVLLSRESGRFGFHEPLAESDLLFDLGIILGRVLGYICFLCSALRGPTAENKVSRPEIAAFFALFPRRKQLVSMDAGKFQAKDQGQLKAALSYFTTLSNVPPLCCALTPSVLKTSRKYLTK